MSFRKEKKFRVTISDYHKFQHQLSTEGMVKLFEPRIINSIYFDTTDLRMFYQSEEGVVPRKKIRIRWYNDQNSFTLENKTSSIEGRYKTTKELSSLTSVEELLKQNLFDAQYGIVHPVLRISYTRSYFTLKAMRITFDEQITYHNINQRSKRIYHEPERVIEIKIPHDCPDDYIKKYIPYSTDRFSKYSRGLLLSMGNLCEI